jgi:hypothetical protein
MGQIRGTPTVKFIVPSKKNKRTSSKKKSVSDYNGERKVGAMYDYARMMMPSHLLKVKSEGDLDKLIAKADKYFLPKFILFTKAKSTQPVTKALSTEFRRRALVGVTKLSKKNLDLVNKYNVDKKQNNVLLVIQDDGKTIRMEKKYTFANAKKFMAQYALSKPYFEDEETMKKIAARDGAKEL